MKGLRSVSYEELIKQLEAILPKEQETQVCIWGKKGKVFFRYLRTMFLWKEIKFYFLK